jgi:hypothetical protein
MSIKSAIDIDKGFSVAPIIANKVNNYICPICKTKVKLNKGDCKICYFSHLKKDNCNWYNNEKFKKVESFISDNDELEKMNIENESIYHKEGKILIKGLIEEGYKISFERLCETGTVKCKKSLIVESVPAGDNSRIDIEYHMKHNDKSIYCDVAHLINGKVDMIYEIYYNHRTAEKNRPNNIKWVDIDVKDIYDIEINNEKTLVLKCSRYYECDECKEFLIQQEKEKRQKEEERRLEEERRRLKRIEELEYKRLQEQEIKQRINELKKQQYEKRQKEEEEIKQRINELKKQQDEKRQKEANNNHQINLIKENCNYFFTLWHLKTFTLRGSSKSLYRYKLKRFLGIYDHLNCCLNINEFCKRCVSYKNTYKDFFIIKE